jgi:hypothetical protein
LRLYKKNGITETTEGTTGGDKPSSKTTGTIGPTGGQTEVDKPSSKHTGTTGTTGGQAGGGDYSHPAVFGL